MVVKMKVKYIIYFLFVLFLVVFSLLFYEARNFLHQHHEVEMKANFTENIYTTYWTFFEDKNSARRIDSEILLSRHVAYKIYGNKTKSVLFRGFYEYFVGIYLNKKEKINIMLNTGIYKEGIKGVKDASTKYFGKDISMLSNDQLYEIFTRMY